MNKCQQIAQEMEGHFGQQLEQLRSQVDEYKECISELEMKVEKLQEGEFHHLLQI